MIAFDHVSKSFDAGQPPAVRDLSLHIEAGQTFVLLGSSGCGKTTTLRMINRLTEPSAGTIRIDGQDVESHDLLSLRRRIGYVFQGIGLFPHMTIEDNVGMVPRILGWPRARRRARANEVLDLVGLPPDQFARRLPRHLSGGQQQRVGVARALAADPAYLLMDEPFGALDAVTREALQREIVQIQERFAKTIVFVTHDVFEALVLADRIGVMHAGTLEQEGPPADLVQRPATPFVKDLFAHVQRQCELFTGLVK